MSNIIVNFPLCEMTMSDIKPGTITDTNSQKGTSGQILSSTGTAIDWVSPYISSAGVSSGNLNMNNFAITSPAVLEMNGGTGMLLNSIGDTCEILGISNVGGITLNANTIAGCSSVDGNNSALTLGQGVNTTSTVIGKPTATTNIQGFVQFGGSAGTSGQYLRSNGTGTVPTWVNGTGAWSGTALTDLNMGGFDIIGADTIDNNAGTMTIGANTTGMTIGKASTITSVNGTLATSTIDRTGSIQIGTTNSTQLEIGRPTVTTTILGTLSTTTIDSNGIALNIGTVSPSTITVGKADTTTATTIRGTLTSASIDNNGGTMTIGANTTGMTIGKASSTNTINGVGVVGGITHSANAITACSSINNAASTNLAIGNTQTTGVLNLGTGATRTGNINLGAVGWSTGFINIARPIFPLYTSSLPAGAIGQIIRYTTLATANFGPGASTINNPYTIPYAGTWSCSATAGINCLSSGTITSIKIYLINVSTSELIAVQSNSVTQNLTPGISNIMNCSGCVATTNTTNSVEVRQELVSTSGSYGQTSFNWTVIFTRIA